MAKFDKTLRDIIQNIPQRFISILTGKKGTKILDNTFPSTKERVADLVLQLEDNSVFHLSMSFLKLPEKQRADYIRKLLIALNYRPKLKEKLTFILEERDMPLTITEKMIKNDPFFKKGKEETKKEDIKNLYKKLKLSPKEIANILEVPIEFVEKVTNEKDKN